MLMNFISILYFPFEATIIGFLLWLDSIGYWLFNKLYKTFLILAQQQLFQDTAFDAITKNVYLIFGVVALFLIAYMLLKAMINPDNDQSNKQLKEMGIRFIICLLLTILLPTIFDFLIDAQNALLERNVVPRIILDGQVVVQAIDENGENVGEQQPLQQYTDEYNINLAAEILELRANEMISIIASGMMYPLKTDKDQFDAEPATKCLGDDGAYHYFEDCTECGTSCKEEWTTDVSEWWDGETKFWTVLGGCAASVVGGAIIMFINPAIGLGSALVRCGVGGVASYLGGSGIAKITADEFTWTAALSAMAYGNFSQITLFAEAIKDGIFHYTPIISTIVIGYLVYMIASFCIDIVVRQAKLIFYKLLAPICFMVSVLPAKKDLMKNWFKLVATTWLEMFIRIALLCFIVLLVGNLNLGQLTSWLHPIISAFIILGLVIFAKQIPKLFKDLTGIDSGNMKLNLKEKLADGGAFVAGGIVLGGAKRLSRGMVNRAKNHLEMDENGKWHLKSGSRVRNVIGSGLLGGVMAVPGVIGTQVSAGRSGYKAKSLSEMLSGVNAAVSKSEKRSADISKYIADHGGTTKGVAVGLGGDILNAIQTYIGLEPDFETLKKQKEAIDDIAKTVKQIKAASEDYVDKHKSEFYVGLSPDDERRIREIRQGIADAERDHDAAAAQMWENERQKFDNLHSSQRLDVMEARTKTIRETLTQAGLQPESQAQFEARIQEMIAQGKSQAEIDAARRAGRAASETQEQFRKRIEYEVAEANNAYNLGRKKAIDSFPSTVQGHAGAEHEMGIMAETFRDLNRQLETYSQSAVVKAFREGRPADQQEISFGNAGQFTKDLKSVYETTEAEVLRQYNDLQRKQAARNKGNK